MALAAGTRLGPYEIQAPLGAGGMGEVYRARDTRLDRTVAIKVLASHLCGAPELKQRMEREARTISSLNHPHICQLYDIGSHDGSDFLVMEFLEGETLAERLRKGPLPIPEILKIGVAIAEALAIAHRQGIVHRDLKPGNIMLTQAGAKLMDFGLAKPIGTQPTPFATANVPAFTAAATLSGPSPLSPLTSAGSIVGTIQYMSPEQIEGKEADARSDIFAFGAVLYEMAAGKRPFEGKSQISLASSILESDPAPLISAKSDAPRALAHVVNSCLLKNPEQRYQSAQDIKLDLQWIASEKPASEMPTPSLSPHAASGRSLVWAFAVVVGILLDAVAGFWLHRAAPAPYVRTVINPPEKTHINLTGDNAGPAILSPDGSTIAFAATGADGKTMIWIRPVDSLEARQVAGTDNAIFPFWSFDSRSIAFFADGKLRIVDLSGGSAQTIADSPFGRGGTWGADGIIVFSPSTQDRLYRVSINGGSPTPVTTLDPAEHTSHRWPFFLPDGKHYLYLAINHNPSKAENDTVYYASVDGGVNKPLLKSRCNAIYAGGYLLFARNQQLLAQAFNPSTGALTGEPQTLARGVINDPITWHMDVAASNDGLLLYGTGGSGTLQFLWMDRAGKRLSPIADDLTNVQAASLSPRGDRLALQIDTGVNDIWVFDLARGTRTRLTFSAANNVFPVWSPDGTWIAYGSPRNGRFQLFRKPSDGSGAEEELLSDEQFMVPSDWSRDGKYIFYNRGTPGAQHLWVLPLDGDRKPVEVVPSTPNTFHSTAMLSPNGHWLAYISNESGSEQIYVVGFNGRHGKWQVSVNGGVNPSWSHDGNELYYVDASNSIYSVPVREAAGALQFGAPQVVVSSWSMPQPFYQFSPDDKRVLLYRVSQQVSDSVTVVTNFTSTLKK